MINENVWLNQTMYLGGGGLGMKYTQYTLWRQKSKNLLPTSITLMLVLLLISGKNMAESDCELQIRQVNFGYNHISALHSDLLSQI